MRGTGFAEIGEIDSRAVAEGPRIRLSRMRYRSYAENGSIFGIDLAPRSLYRMKEDIRWQWEHSIPPVRDKRYSVTLRTLADKGARRAKR